MIIPDFMEKKETLQKIIFSDNIYSNYMSNIFLKLIR